jgi:hypothetical protein
VSTIRRTATYQDFAGGLFEPPVAGAGQTAPVEDMALNEFLAFDNWAFSVRAKGIHSRNGFLALGAKAGLVVTHVCGVPGSINLLVAGTESAAPKIYLFNGSTFTLVSSPGGAVRQLYAFNDSVYVAVNGAAPIKITAGSAVTWTTPLSDVITFGSIGGRLLALEEGDTYLWISGLNSDTHWIGDDSGRITIPRPTDFGTLLTFARHKDGVLLFTSRGIWFASSISLGGFEIDKVSEEVTVLSTALHAMRDVEIGGARGVMFVASDGKPYLATFGGVRPLARGVLGSSRTFKDAIAYSARMGQVLIPDNTGSMMVAYTDRKAGGFFPIGRWTSSMFTNIAAVCHQNTTTTSRFVVGTTDGGLYALDCLHPDESGFLKDDQSGSNFYQIPAVIRTRPENVNAMNLKIWKEARLYLSSIPGITTITATQYFGNPHGADVATATASPARVASIPISGIREHSSLSIAFSDSATASTAKTSHVFLSSIEVDFLPGPRK